MQKELELFLRNKRVVAQNYGLVETHPYRFWREGQWVSRYIVHLNLYISGLSLRGEIENSENGDVKTSLVYSFYGDNYLNSEEIQRRNRFVQHLKKYGAYYKEEPPIRWFE